LSESDDLLLARLLKSSESESKGALKEVFFKYGQSLISLARRFTKDRETSEDIVQNVFLSIWRNRSSLVIEKGLKMYLYRAVRNQALNVLREARLVQEAHEKIRLTITPSKNFFDKVGYDELLKAIQRAIDSLPAQCREIFLMSRIDSLTYLEIAELLNLSEKTVETQMGRALKRLRQSLTDEFLGIIL